MRPVPAMPPPRPRPRRQKRGSCPASADEALGRSRGGFTTKLHLAFDGQGRPLSIILTAGQRHDSTQLESTLDGIRVPRRRGRPRKRPHQVTGDKGYSYPKCRRALRQRGIRHVIPERKDQREQRQQKGPAGGRAPRFDKTVYRLRSWAERGVNRLKQWRAVATRYEKRAHNYLALVQIASIMIWLAA
jgi:transposase